MVQLPSERHRPSDASRGDRVRGRVLWFDQVQGVGVAAVPGRGQVHVYHKEIRTEGYRALDAGDTISCWVEETGRGPVARDVHVEASLPRE